MYSGMLGPVLAVTATISIPGVLLELRRAASASKLTARRKIHLRYHGDIRAVEYGVGT
jgi:hypothetical protein